LIIIKYSISNIQYQILKLKIIKIGSKESFFKLKMIPLISFQKGIQEFHNPINPLPKILSKSTTILYYKIVSFVLFCILLIFVFRVVFAKDEIKQGNAKSITFLELEPKLQTGDLVFVSYKNTLGYFMRGWADSVWTHVGMIMRDGNELYVMETADYSSLEHVKDVVKPSRDIIESSKDISLKRFNKKGIFVIPFEIWKSFNKHHPISCIPLETTQELGFWDRRKLILEFWKIQQSKLDEFGVGVSVWSKVLWKKKFENQDTKEKQNITCFELIVKLLQNTNVAKKIYTPGSYYTGELAARKLELEDGFRFGKPYIISK
jgi:hypothetical protein